MDLICPICGEAWDFDTLHEEAEMLFDDRHPDFRTSTPNEKMNMRAEYTSIFSEVAGEFRSAGCIALRNFRGTDQGCTAAFNDRTLMAQAAYEACGDDMDGAAAMLGDML